MLNENFEYVVTCEDNGEGTEFTTLKKAVEFAKKYSKENKTVCEINIIGSIKYQNGKIEKY